MTVGEPALAPGYVFDSDFASEEVRLGLGATLWDPGTFERLTRLGPLDGARCLEAGAGTGSVAAWLAERVGPAGEVVATDLRTDRLDWLRGGGVTVLRHDVATDALGEDAFDLVHARLVVQHLPQRHDVVGKLARALRPGGVLVCEDTDTAALFSHAARDDFLAEVKRAAYAVMREAGYHAACSLLDVELIEQAGLHDVTSDGRARVVRGGTDAVRWFGLWIEHLSPAMLARGSVDASRLDAALAELRDPANRWLTQVMVTTSGRRPE